MRVGAQWTDVEQTFPDHFDPAWLGIGYITADLGAILIILSALGLRRLQRGSGVRSVAPSGFSILLLAAYLVAVWAMTAKPI